MEKTHPERGRPLLRALAEPANLLSLSRIPLALGVWWVAHSPARLLGLTALAGLTDLVDGRLARRGAERRGESAARAGGIGDWLDPLCDKVFVASALCAAVVTYRPPGYLLALVLARDLLQVPLLLAWLGRHGRQAQRMARRVDFRANVLGKATTVAQFAALLAIVLASPAQVPCALIACGLGILSVASYARRFARVTPPHAPTPRPDAPAHEPAQRARGGPLNRGSRWRPRRRRTPRPRDIRGSPRRSRGR